MCHYILDNNSHISWWISALFILMETEVKKFTISPCVSPLPDKTKTT